MTYQIKLYIFVGIGGMVGSVLRYSTSLLISNTDSFPLATFSVNLLGSFLLSLLLFSSGLRKRISKEFLTALTVGLIGSFTTFSTVTYEIIELWQASALFASVYVFSSLFGSLGLCYIALLIAKRLQVKK